MDMSFFAFGVNHESAPVEVREAFELTEASVRELYQTANLRRGVEWILLSTCNRTEVWMYGTASDAGDIQSALLKHCGSWPSEYTFVCENKDAIRHILEVVSGLRSQILGDGQILSQVKSAYRLSAACSAVGPRMHRLIHAAFATAKRVISTTALGSGTPSVARTAVLTLRKQMENDQRSFRDLTVLVLGCGSMGVRVLKELGLDPPGTCYLANRTGSRAKVLAEKYGAVEIPWDLRHRFMAEADVVIVTTSAPEYVACASDFNEHGERRHTLIVDISVPRNVDPSLSEKPGFEVLNIDELSSSNGRNQVATRRDIDRARAICSQAVEEALGWEDERAAVELAVRVLEETFESIRRHEVERNIHRFTAQDHEHVERLTRSIIQKLLAIPIVQLKKMTNGQADLTQRLELLSSLFDRGNCEE